MKIVEHIFWISVFWLARTLTFLLRGKLKTEAREYLWTRLAEMSRALRVNPPSSPERIAEAEETLQWISMNADSLFPADVLLGMVVGEVRELVKLFKARLNNKSDQVK